MNAETNKTQWIIPLAVAIFGAIGGVTAYVWSTNIGDPSLSNGTAGIAVNIFLGAVASFIGVYALKVDSTRFILHTLALALLFGLAWKPTLQAGRDFVVTQISETNISEQAEFALDIIESLESASPEMAPVLIEELESVSSELIRAGASIKNPKLNLKVGRVVAESVEALSDSAKIAPEAVASALGSVGKVALSQGDMRVSNAVAESLVFQANKQQHSVGLSSEASNSLLRLSGAARAQGQDDRADALKEHSMEIFSQAKSEAGEDREFIMELEQRSIVTDELRPKMLQQFELNKLQRDEVRQKELDESRRRQP